MKEKFIKIFNYIKENIKTGNKKMQIAALIALFSVLVLIINLYSSYAYYHQEISFPILSAKIGDQKELTHDYSLKVYLEGMASNGRKEYNLVNFIPMLGYTYSGYSCKNNSTLIYDAVNRTTSVTTDKIDHCNIYFDLINDMDIVIKIKIETEVNSDIYEDSKIIPAYGYVYDHYECNNDSTLIYNGELHKFKLSTNRKEICTAYFKKKQEDININLYINMNGDYIESDSIPPNQSYSLNNNSECLNNNNERINATITYQDGYININTPGISYCNIYLD